MDGHFLAALSLVDALSMVYEALVKSSTIIDPDTPFTGMLTTTSSLLLSLPAELNDAIIFLITSATDLLNLALTCRQLCRLVIPDHIDYRQFVCSTSDRFVWEHFLNSPHLAKRIHSAEIVDDVEFKDTGTEVERRVIPRKLRMRSTQEDGAKPEGGSQLKVFTKSISVMRDLYSFSYRGPCPAFVLFTCLAHCSPGLRIFKYNYEWINPDRTSQWRDILDPGPHLSRGFEYLECCSLNIRFQGQYDNEANVVTMIDSLSENSHSLESFTFFFWGTLLKYISLVRLLSSANWPNIRSFSLGGDFTIFEEDAIDLQLPLMRTQSFFFRHTLLERVRLSDPRNNPICPGSIQPDMFLKLHTLDLGFQSTYPVSELIPENVIARLVNLSVNLDNVPDSFITSGHFKNLRRLYTKVSSSDSIPLLIEAIPNIERLHITLDDIIWCTDRWGKDPGILHFLPDFIKHSKSLTHLSFLLPSRAEAVAPEEYAWKLEKLEFIQFSSFMTMLTPWYRVIRSSSGTVSLERHVERSDEWTQHLWMGFDSSFE